MRSPEWVSQRHNCSLFLPIIYICFGRWSFPSGLFLLNKTNQFLYLISISRFSNPLFLLLSSVVYPGCLLLSPFTKNHISAAVTPVSGRAEHISCHWEKKFKHPTASFSCFCIIIIKGCAFFMNLFSPKKKLLDFHPLWTLTLGTDYFFFPHADLKHRGGVCWLHFSIYFDCLNFCYCHYCRDPGLAMLSVGARWWVTPQS